MSFRETRTFLRGRAGEQIAADWLKTCRSWYVIPSYDYAGEGGDKPPRLEGLAGQYAVPDLDVSRGGCRRWAEVKTKTGPAWYRKTQEWRHGISCRLLQHYRQVQEITGTEVWLLILEESTGCLLGQSLAVLGAPHTGTDRGTPMAYWPRGKFTELHRFEDLPARIRGMLAANGGGR